MSEGSSKKDDALADLEDLMELKIFKKEDTEHFKSKAAHDYVRNLSLKAEPEAAIIQFFHQIFDNVDLTDQIKAGGGNADFLVHTDDKQQFILEFKKYFEYDPKKREFHDWRLNPFIKNG